MRKYLAHLAGPPSSPAQPQPHPKNQAGAPATPLSHGGKRKTWGAPASEGRPPGGAQKAGRKDHSTSPLSWEPPPSLGLLSLLLSNCQACSACQVGWAGSQEGGEGTLVSPTVPHPNQAM